ncbi:uncharacterized protein LOC113554133 isoform X1 [Rhopalosiphum maidis]|uniref:uncharacterized protein LOC113554133 isoform X1 n=2 Tax=Rhopalosiphum maidis TaxID=43146 RepID=UPI000EFE8D63|nr:uncharacterized protein LOC113554133 isoform X1 [Rhopalosiphum maidis]
MADRRKLNKNINYLNQNSMNNLILLMYIMVLMFPSNSSTLETMSNKINCSDSMTCSKCTIKPMCVWSLKQQTCENKNKFNSSSLIASRVGECPQFSVVKEFKYTNLWIECNFTVKLSNDLVGFKNYLNNYTINICTRLTTCHQMRSKTNNEMMILSNVLHLNSTYLTGPSYTIFIFIKFNDIMLRFDNVADNFITFNRQEECSADDTTSCAICAWNNDGYSNYFKWCSFKNACKIQNETYLKNNGKKYVHENITYVTNDCAEINVTSVDPLSAPKTGGTIVTIIIRNHRIFAENRTITVTVAGTVCSNPRTSGSETITCTTSQPNETPSGPVLVEYSSPTGGVLKIESSQIFQFYNVSSTCGTPSPVLDADQQLGGVASGGTSVSIRGDHFVEPCVVSSARLYVDLSDGVRRHADSYCDPPINDTYMVCRSPRVNGIDWNGDASTVGQLLDFGLDITFSKDDLSGVNQSQLVAVRSPMLKYYVHPDPFLVDFEVDGNGSVVVNGLHLQYVLPEDIVIRPVDSPSVRCVVFLATRHSLMCQPTASVATLQVISVTFGNSLVHTVIRKASPSTDDPSKLPGWFRAIVAISVGLIFVFALVCCLRTKHRYDVTKNIRNPSDNASGSQDLYIHTAM